MEIAHLHFPTIGSTNNYAKDHADQFGLGAFTILSADEQTTGRGRGQRTWTSPAGVNLYLSFCSFVPKDFPDLHNSAQLLSLVCSDLLRELGVSSALKWPNDVLVHGKKVAGLLCDIVACGDQTLVINGMGLNVNMPEKDCALIPGEATSLYVESGQTFDRDDLIKRLITIYANYWERFKSEGFRPFLGSYRRRSAHQLGDNVSFHVDGEIMCGEFHSVADDGSLNLLLPDGSVKNFRS